MLTYTNQQRRTERYGYKDSHCVNQRQRERQLVSWCFQPSQTQRDRERDRDTEREIHIQNYITQGLGAIAYS